MAAVGWRDSQAESGRALHRQRRQRRAERAGHEDRARACADAVRRSPGAQGAHRALGQRQEQYRWKDSVQNGAEIRIWVADGIANDLRPWYTKFGGVLYDRRWLKVVEDIYTWHHRCERYLRNEDSLARVAMVYSQQTATFYGGESARQNVEDHTLGMYQALIEARIPFEMAHDQLLDVAHIDKFKLLILPNIAALSDAQCDQLRRYVGRGGSLLATHETSLYDQWGVRRQNFGLSDLFGAKYNGRVEGPMQNSYLRLENKQHPILVGFGDTDRIINGARRVDVSPVG